MPQQPFKSAPTSPAAAADAAAACCSACLLLLLVLLQDLPLPLLQRCLCCSLHVAFLRRLRRPQLPRPINIPAAQQGKITCYNKCYDTSCIGLYLKKAKPFV
jgi:hypothetical protein